MKASEAMKLPLIGTGRRIAFTRGGVRYQGRFTAKSVSSMSDVFEDEKLGFVELPWLTPNTIDEHVTDVVLDPPLS